MSEIESQKEQLSDSLCELLAIIETLKAQITTVEKAIVITLEVVK